MSDNSIWPIDRILSDATTPSQSVTGSNSNEEVFPIPQSFSLTTRLFRTLDGVGVLPSCRDAIGIFHSTSRLSWWNWVIIKKCIQICLSLPLSLFIYIYITLVEGDPKALFPIATTPRCRGGHYSFPGLLHFTLNAYLIMLNVKHGGIKYHFLSLSYDST